MAYVPSFEHDVFISYAHPDNDPFTGARVTAFHAELVRSLQSNLGNRAYSKPDEWIFFDHRGIDYGDRVTPKLEYKARRSAVMIALISESYFQSGYCKVEWQSFLEAGELALDPVERRLIPVLFVDTPQSVLERWPRLTQDMVRATQASAVIPQLVQHLRKARENHGAIFVAPPYRGAREFREKLVAELRGFRCVPEGAAYGDEAAIKRMLAEAKLAIHFLGDEAQEVPESFDLLDWSLEHCPGKTLALLPPGSRLVSDDKKAITFFGSHPQWKQPEGTITELAEHISGLLEAFRLPDPAIPIGLACDQADFSSVCGFAREIYDRSHGSYRVEVPDFLANPAALHFRGWRNFCSRRQGLVLYCHQGRQSELDDNILARPLSNIILRTWYLSLFEDPNAPAKLAFEPPPPTEKIVDEHQRFSYEKIRPFLEEVKRQANKPPRADQ